MPPCSVPSMRWNCSSVIGAVAAAVQSASFVKTSSAAALPAWRCASRRPAQDLVHRVPRHADELPARHRVLELRRAVRERADEPVSRLRLTRVQLGDDVVGTLLHAVIACRRVHQRDSGEVVPERVAVATDVDPRLLRLPAAVDRRLRLEPRVHAEVVEHPVGLQREEIVEVALLRVEERAVQQPHVVK